MYKNEAEFTTAAMIKLNQAFGKAIFIVKNHGDMYQQAGRPDIEGVVFGRHIGLELKTYPNRFEGRQKAILKQMHTAGSFCGGLVYDHRTDSVYFLNVGQCVNFSWRNVKTWKRIGSSNGKWTWLFVHRFLFLNYCIYHGSDLG